MGNNPVNKQPIKQIPFINQEFLVITKYLDLSGVLMATLSILFPDITQ